MYILDAKNAGFKEINQVLRERDEVKIVNCLGQRFIGAGMRNKKIDISGTPGNALGAYFDGGEITVKGNAQDAVGDTMNAGKIVIHGNVGDAVGYAMRGGAIYIKGNAGYRAGIHMKAYREKIPVIVIGGAAGSFLGEYQAGGIIIALGIDIKGDIVGNFPCTGMHGGRMLLRSDCKNIRFPHNVNIARANENTLAPFTGYIKEYCNLFGVDYDKLMDAPFTLLSPDSKNPYKQMYVMN